MSAKDTLIEIAVIGVAAFVLYKVLAKGFQQTSQLLADTGSAIGSGLFDMFHPNQVGEMIFYSVTFPAPNGDGLRHAIPSRSVNANGQFLLGAEFAPNVPVPSTMRHRWQIVADKNGNKFATPA